MASLLAMTRSNRRCPKCGTIKTSGKHSCCARGGAWFKNCGDVGNTQFDHTWIEGIQACKGSATSDSVESPLQVVQRYTEVGVYPFDITQTRNATRQQTNIYRSYNVVNTDARGSEGCVAFMKAIFFIYSVFCTPNLCYLGMQ